MDFLGGLRRSVDMAMSGPRGVFNAFTNGSGNDATTPSAPMQPPQAPAPQDSNGPATNDPYIAAIMSERNRLMKKSNPQVTAIPSDPGDAYRAAIQGEQTRLIAQQQRQVPSSMMANNDGIMRRSMG